MDILTIVGVFVGIGAILVGQSLEGGNIDSLLNGPAILIVLGGTMGAVMIQAPLSTFLYSLRMSAWLVFPPKLAALTSVENIISWSNIARKEGLLGLEVVVESEQDPFSRKGLQLLVDGSEPEVIRSILEVEIDSDEKAALDAARIYEIMGGYTPTIGIIGAVLGLIHVMQNLADPSSLGAGIATAFVATIYGVGLANLLLLPIGGKLKGIIGQQSRMREMIVEGLISIAEGENPRNIETKLNGYLK
jgi:chemotaxis protein MotA